MKKVIVVFFSLTILATACGKKTEDIIPAQGSISMKVDGVSWTGQVAAQMIDNETLVVNAINATAANQETVGIIIEKATKTGIYKIKGRSGNGFLFSRKAVIHSGSEDGEVTITAINTTGGKTVPSGTFKATCIAINGAKVVITEGKF